MAKVTSKLQVTVPKAIADRYGIRPGDEIAWLAAGDMIRVVPVARRQPADDPATRVKLFDQATARQQGRQGRQPKVKSVKVKPVKARGWKREDLYRRGRTR